MLQYIIKHNLLQHLFTLSKQHSIIRKQACHSPPYLTATLFAPPFPCFAFIFLIIPSMS